MTMLCCADMIDRMGERKEKTRFNCGNECTLHQSTYWKIKFQSRKSSSSVFTFAILVIK